MKSKWLVDNYLIETSYHEDFSKVLKRMGHEVIVDKYIPFSEKPQNIHYDDSDCVVIYGSIGFTHQYVKDRKFIPGAYCQEKAMECMGYMPKIDNPAIMANQNHVMSSFRNFVDNKNFFYNIFNTDKVFIRPNSGFKTFTGLPIHLAEFDFEINSLRQLTSVADDTLILVSSCKTIKEEYRFFIVNREVVDGSRYKLNEELNIAKGYSQEALEIAKIMCNNKWQPDLAYACDVGIVNGEPKIIELNSFSCSGFYAADMEKLVEAVDNIAVLEHAGEISIGE